MVISFIKEYYIFISLLFAILPMLVMIGILIYFGIIKEEITPNKVINIFAVIAIIYYIILVYAISEIPQSWRPETYQVEVCKMETRLK